jgi:protein SCO1/2
MTRSTIGASQTRPAPGSIAERVGFDQHLDESVPLNLTFRDESGRAVSLDGYFHKRPVILTLVYYNCPLLCTQVLNGLTRSLKPLSPSIGRDFDVVTVSINPEETPDLALAKKAAYLGRYDRDRDVSASGWHFLTGDPASIRRLADSVGFRYSYDPKTKLYAHAAGIVILTPEGKISRYFYGIDFPAKDLQYSLQEASAGRVGSPIARLLLLCYDYDAATGKYTLAIVRLLRVLGVATAMALGTYMLLMFRREHRQVSALTGPDSQLTVGGPTEPNDSTA